MTGLVAASASLALAACGDEDSGHSNTVDCDVETRDDVYEPGLSKTGEAGLTFTIVEATPAPPARNDNTWIVELAQDGTPVAADDFDVMPFMPDHGHGTPTVTDVTPGAATGEYTLEPVNMFMPGLWEITLTASVGDVTDSVVFRFCIPS